MNVAGYAIRHKAVTLVFTLIVMIGGTMSYGKLGRLEDPEFTIKTAVVITQYPGATAEEVEQEVTERLESALQQLKQLDEVRSISRAGMSVIYADMQDKYDKDTLPQVWDELRRKVGEAARNLPPNCGQPLVNDDYGDVSGVFFALTGDGYSYREIQEFADDLRRELLQCQDVGRIDFWGRQTEVVYVEIDRTKLAQLGVSPQTIFGTIDAQNAVTGAGEVRVGSENFRLRVTGVFTDVKELGDVLVRGGGRMIRLKDVAKIERGVYEPASTLLRRDGKSAVGLGISTVSGGNVVVMGDAIKKRLAELRTRIPVGIEVTPISFQADTVREAVDGFVWNLAESVVIVVGLLVIFMGLREGFVMGAVLLVTILGTFIGMKVLDVELQRISLGALIIALGMLVDNAIVVAEGVVIKSHHGLSRTKAAEETVHETQWPLLGATCIAILAFAAISLSNDTTGEFLGSLFTVIALSLGFSWIVAVTITPYLCVKFLPEQEKNEADPHGNWFYSGYRRMLEACIDHRARTILVVVGLMMLAMFGFGFVKHNFFPDSARQQITLDVWLPEGTHIDHTADVIAKIDAHVRALDGVADTTAFIGSGGMRFILTYMPESPSAAYGQLLVSVKSYDRMFTLMPELRAYLDRSFPEATTKLSPFKLGPSSPAFEARFLGPDADVLRSLAEQAEAILRADGNTLSVRNDWGERVKVASVRMAEARARETGVSRTEIGQSLAMNFSGSSVGLFRDGDTMLPILLRPTVEQREGVDNLPDVLVWSAANGRMIPIEQVADGVDTGWEDAVIQRRDRVRTVTVSCQQSTGTSDTLFRRLRGPVEAIKLSPGYALEWGGEYESSTDANAKLMANVPLAFAMMFLVTVMLFDTLRHPLIIFLGLPLALIGVSAGLLLSGQPFGFMATLGFLSLAGMLIKNEIVLLDQINIDLAAGKEPFTAVVDSSVSRVRPVCMAAFTTVLGMIPLLWDVFFAAMAVTIMAGLTFATLLTLVVVPTLYATLFGVHRPKPAA